jgi:hypothetical protein
MSVTQRQQRQIARLQPQDRAIVQPQPGRAAQDHVEMRKWQIKAQRPRGRIKAGTDDIALHPYQG